MKVVAALLCAAVAAFFSVSASAQDITGTPGTPGATSSISGKQLPPPDPTFGGVINEKASNSTPWWPLSIVPPKGAPNALLIMTHDQASRRRASDHNNPFEPSSDVFSPRCEQT